MKTLPLSLFPLVLASVCRAAVPMDFDFGSGPVTEGFTGVRAATLFSADTGFGFEPGGAVEDIARTQPDPLRGDVCASEKPFLFSVVLPEGNYRVTLTSGDQEGTSDTVVKAEDRRLFTGHIITKRGESAVTVFTVNVRAPVLPGGGAVKLSDREKGGFSWDGKLTLEFNGLRPCVAALSIIPEPQAPTLFLLGDSTVADQPKEPLAAWGQMLPRFFPAGLAVANHAASGESLSGARKTGRLDKVLASLKSGDWVMIQFGHNDQKLEEAAAGAFTVFTADMKKFVAEVRDKGGVPLLVTPVNRNSFDSSGKIRNTLGDYPEAVRRVAAEEKVALIDLHKMSATLYEAIGPARLKTAAFVDGSHHNNYGAYELARCVIETLRVGSTGLERWITEGNAERFDPAKPDPTENFPVPATPGSGSERPAGE